MKFVAAHQLRRHVETHRTEAPFKCSVPDCGESFVKSFMLREHMFVHTGVKAFECDHAECSLAFVTKKELTRHRRAHNRDLNPKHACPHEGCVQAFNKMSKRQTHLRTSHPERFMHTCTHASCAGKSKTFRSKSKLRAHMKSHDPATRVPCPFPDCGKTFSQRSNLNTHIRAVHHASRPFVCPISGCTSSFAYKQSLSRHIEAHNKALNSPKRSLRTNNLSFRAMLCGRARPVAMDTSLNDD